MFRNSILSLILVLTVVATVFGDQSTMAPTTNVADACTEILQDFTICLYSVDPDSDFDGDDSMIDDVACTKCYTENGLYLGTSDGVSCEMATTEVCGFFDQCKTVCFPKFTVCTEEASSYYSCIFGSIIAPTNCVVKCEENVLDGGENQNPTNTGGGDQDGSQNDEQNDNEDTDSTSGTSTAPIITWSGISSIASIVAGLTV